MDSDHDWQSVIAVFEISCCPKARILASSFPFASSLRVGSQTATWRCFVLKFLAVQF
jgi:hypothetical protein